MGSCYCLLGDQNAQNQRDVASNKYQEKDSTAYLELERDVNLDEKEYKIVKNYKPSFAPEQKKIFDSLPPLSFTDDFLHNDEYNFYNQYYKIAKKNQIYYGTWKDAQPNGRGEVYGEDGSYYVGEDYMPCLLSCL
jgi:hypothetical protein